MVLLVIYLVAAYSDAGHRAAFDEVDRDPGLVVLVPVGNEFD